MTKRQIKQTVFSSIGTIIFAICVGFCCTAYSKAVMYSLIAAAPLIALLFFLSIFFKKEKLYKIALIVVYFGIILLLAVTAVMRSGILDKISTAEDIKNIVLSFGALGKLVFIFIQFLQVTFIPIPSTIVTAAGAAIYPLWESLLLSCVGLLIGSVFAFFLGKAFGVRLVKWVIGEDMLIKYQTLMKGKDKAMLVYMFIFPIFPDDMLCMIAGLTTMSYSTFFVIQLIARPLNVAATVFLVDRIKAIPFSGYGIAIWLAIAAVFVVVFVLMWKYADKLEAGMLKFIAKITGKERRKRIKEIAIAEYNLKIKEKQLEAQEEELRSEEQQIEETPQIEQLPTAPIEKEKTLEEILVDKPTEIDDIGKTLNKPTKKLRF